MTADGTLAGYLEAAARAAPSRPALRDRRREVTYQQLDEVVGALAALLEQHGVRPGARVGVWLNKSLEAVTAMHATVRAGAAYVPVDPTAPARRAAHLIADCGVSCLFTTADRVVALLRAGAPPPSGLLVLVGDGEPGPVPGPTVLTWAQGVALGRRRPGPAAAPGPDDTAYILYTSGSTGEPKGVVLTHRNACAFVGWAAAELGLVQDDVLASHAPLHFDLSVFDVFGAAAARACVALVPENRQGSGAALARFVAEEQVSVWYSVPGALRRMAEAAGNASLRRSRLRVVAFAGESYPVSQLITLRDALPAGTALYNLYGPTETNVCTFHRLGAGDFRGPPTAVPPIGRPCPYATAALLGDDGTVLASGWEATGELYVGGASVMAGYWGNAAATAARMTELPSLPGLYYRTGDIVRRDPEGRYSFVGRADDMVKVRGYRAEPGEVEAALSAHPAVAESACVAVPHPADGSMLVAFIAERAGCRVDEPALRRHCRELLPRYMVPARIEVVRALARTSTGKTDRQALALLAAEQRNDQQRQSGS